MFTHMPKRIEVVVGEFEFLEGDELSHPVRACGWRVGMHIEPAGHCGFCLSCHWPRAHAKNIRTQSVSLYHIVCITFPFKSKTYTGVVWSILSSIRRIGGTELRSNRFGQISYLLKLMSESWIDSPVGVLIHKSSRSFDRIRRVPLKGKQVYWYSYPLWNSVSVGFFSLPQM